MWAVLLCPPLGHMTGALAGRHETTNESRLRDEAGDELGPEEPHEDENHRDPGSGKVVERPG